jgi:hypothetical protein
MQHAVGSGFRSRAPGHSCQRRLSYCRVVPSRVRVDAVIATAAKQTAWQRGSVAAWRRGGLTAMLALVLAGQVGAGRCWQVLGVDVVEGSVAVVIGAHCGCNGSDVMQDVCCQAGGSRSSGRGGISRISRISRARAGRAGGGRSN